MPIETFPEQRLRAENAALRAELAKARLLSAAVESSDDAILTKDLDDNITSWNQGAERMFGYTAEEIVGKHLSVLVPPERWDDMSLIIERIRAGERVEHFETQRLTRDGRLLAVSVTVSPVYDDAGQIVGASKIVRDISALKQAELEQREANQRKDEFLAMLAHELRNPLAPICNAVQILRMTGEHTPAMEQATGMIGRQVNQLIRLVDDLLDVSRVSRGKINLQKEPVDLVAVVHQAVETSQPLIKSREHTLEMTLPPHKIRVDGDFTRLAQVISNLLNNAAKYTDAGGVISVSVELATPENPSPGAEAVIRVRDNGRGIDPLILDCLFDLFYQADRNIDRAEGGLGIGLSLVKSLVDMHGGRVEVHSEGKGRGSEFAVYLPCQMEEQALQPVQADGQETPTQSHSILLVEDNPDVADSMAMLLELYGHEVLVAHDGRRGVELAVQEKPAMVLLDIGLPDMNGYETCRAMRAAGLEDVLIVALTGYHQDEDRTKAAEAGFDWHLAKPVDIQVLEDLLASLPVR